MSCFFSSEKILRPHSCCPPNNIDDNVPPLEFYLYLSIINHMMVVVIDKLRNTYVKHIIIHSLQVREEVMVQQQYPLFEQTHHMWCKFGEGINAQSFFSSLTHGKIMSCCVFSPLRKSYVHIPAAPPTTLIMFLLWNFYLSINHHSYDGSSSR